MYNGMQYKKIIEQTTKGHKTNLTTIVRHIFATKSYSLLLSYKSICDRYFNTYASQYFNL